MFSESNHSKLKTNLKISIQRLKLMEKKKTENARKSTKEIADMIQTNKYDRARIKVEHIIREDYLVEGIEIVEMYCDLLLARFGLFESMKELDLGLYECVASLIWVSPRLEAECAELKVIANELEKKYGKEFAQMCRSNKCQKVNERLMLKMSEQAPDSLLVEKYLVEISKSHNVPFKPNTELAVRDPNFFYDFVSEKDSKNYNVNKGDPIKQLEEGIPVKSTPMFSQVHQVSYIGFNQSQSNQTQLNKQNKDFKFPSVPDKQTSFHDKNFIHDEGDDSFDKNLTARFNDLKKK